uniref:Uncharacterized protein n=1 Tax=Babesia bovis TaxID=5865 RepID=S6B1A0_BABBO|nr:hypothetical protein [Babesia bovis]
MLRITTGNVVRRCRWIDGVRSNALTLAMANSTGTRTRCVVLRSCTARVRILR